MTGAKRISTLGAIAAAALTVGCDQEPAAFGGADLTTTVDTVGGVIRVSNTGTPPEWRLVPVVSIGPKTLTDQGAPEEFGRVTAVALGPDDNVFVADTRNHEVRVFGLDGTHRRNLGREGEGPGEFGSLYSVAWVGDRLLTFDPHQGRIGEFSAEGEWLGQRSTTRGMTGSPAFIRFYPVGTNEAFRFARDPDLGMTWVGLDNLGETGDTMPMPRMQIETEGLPGGGAAIVCEYEGGISFFGHPSAARYVQHPASNGVAYSAWGYFYRIAVTRAEGDTLRIIERDLPEEPISDEEWAAGGEDFQEFRDRRRDASCDPRSFSRPDRKSFIQEIFVAPDGVLWVEVIRTAGNRWEFFDTEGRLLGSVPAVPYKERTVPVFSGEHLATIRQDELELDHVDVWRLKPIR